MKELSDVESIYKLLKLSRPKLFWPIWNTIICSGPPLNLLFRYFLWKEIENPTTLIIANIIAIAWASFVWYYYTKQKREFRIFEKKMSIILHYITTQEKSPITDALNELDNITSEKEASKRFQDILDKIDID